MAENAQDSNHLRTLQILRGVAALFVSLHHYVQLAFQGQTPGPVSTFLWERGPLAVDVFFILSGFIMAHTAPRYVGRGRDFLVNRLSRVIPNYWFYTLLLLGSTLLLDASCYLTGWTTKSLILSFLLVPNPNPNGHGDFPFLYVGWTLTYELVFYTILGCSLLFFRRRYLVATGVALCALPAIFHGHHPFGLGNGFFIEFLAGMILRTLWGHRARFTGAMPRVVALVAGLPLLVLVLGRPPSLPTDFALALWIVINAILLDPLLGNGPLTRLLVRSGDLSYSIYLSHIVVLGWVLALVGRRSTDLEHVGASTLFILVVWGVSSLTWRYIETGAFPSFLRDRLTHLLGGRRE